MPNFIEIGGVTRKPLVVLTRNDPVSNSVVYLAAERIQRLEINNMRASRFFAYKKILGRTEMRTRDRICFQTIRSVRDISRDDRARIATCSLRTATDRFKANYSVDT